MLSIKVASYNIHKAIGADGRRDPARILGVLAEIDADVVILQEADRRFGSRAAVLPPALLASHSPYDPVAFEPGKVSLGWHGNALLIRRGTGVVSTQTIALPSFEPRGAITADLAIGGHRFRVVGMHLDLSGLRRNQQARAVVDHVAALPTLPTVLMGDTNEWRSERGCLAVFHQHFASVRTPPSFPARSPMLRLDRLMIRHPFEIVESGTHRSTLARQASDHLPIWASLKCEQPV